MHGGDIYRNKVELDYSVNINPLGIPEGVRKACKDALLELEHYPDIKCEKVKQEIARHFQVSEDKVLCGNGASELIMAMCHGIHPKKALLLAPGFYGYIDALEAVGAKISYYQLEEAADFFVTEDILQAVKEVKPDMMFITNPNNPTGRTLTKERLCKVLKACKETGTILVVDECFFELTGLDRAESVINEIENYNNLIVLRAFTKSFAIPGVRLGYALCGDAALYELVAKNLPEWNLSVIAQRAAIAAMKETEFLEKSRELIKSQREYLQKELEQIGMKVYPSDTNYILFFDGKYKEHKTEDKELYQELLKKEILIRDCSDYYGLGDGFYRIAVKRPKENKTLIGQIKEILGDE